MTPYKDQVEQIKLLIEKASKAHDSGDAMRLSQAAQNAANTLMTLRAVNG